jgi:hypothetical protein
MSKMHRDKVNQSLAGQVEENLEEPAVYVDVDMLQTTLKKIIQLIGSHNIKNN